MLGKLIKYDLKWTYKILVIFYILTIAFAVIGRGLSLIDNSVIFDFLSKFSYGVSVSFMFSILINNMMRLWARFIQNIYKDEAYLTHTLPVRKRDIYFSKVISTMITLFTSFMVIVLGLIICYYGESLINFLETFITDSLLSVIIYALIVLYFEVLFIEFLGYLAIVIGYKNNHGKFVKSLIWGFGLYMISSMISLIVLFIVALFNNDIMNLFTSSNVVVDTAIIKLILAIAMILYLVYIILCNVVSSKLLTRGVDVD